MDHYVTCALFFCLGYILGRLDSIVRLPRSPENNTEVAQVTRYERLERETPGNFTVKRKVQIDDSKFVTDLSTEGMTSSGKESLGTITQTEDTIGTAASKLAALKGRKG